MVGRRLHLGLELCISQIFLFRPSQTGGRKQKARFYHQAQSLGKFWEFSLRVSLDFDKYRKYFLLKRWNIFSCSSDMKYTAIPRVSRGVAERITAVTKPDQPVQRSLTTVRYWRGKKWSCFSFENGSEHFLSSPLAPITWFSHNVENIWCLVEQPRPLTPPTSQKVDISSSNLSASH